MKHSLEELIRLTGRNFLFPDIGPVDFFRIRDGGVIRVEIWGKSDGRDVKNEMAFTGPDAKERCDEFLLKLNPERAYRFGLAVMALHGSPAATFSIVE